MDLLSFWRRREPDPIRPLSQLVRENPELAQLFAQFGYAPDVRAEVHRILESLKSLIQAEVTDFAAFRRAVQAALTRSAGDSPRFEVTESKLLEAVVAAGEDDQAVLAALNHDPIHEQMPFVERIPVMKRGEVAWMTPVDHACILKRPSDPAKFATLLDELESHFREPHPARTDALRLQVAEAITRVRRELARERAYFPTSIQSLESRIDAYDSDSLQPSAQAAVQKLTGILESMEVVRSRCSLWPRLEEAERRGLLHKARESAGLYLADSKLWTSWMGDYLAETLLSPALLESAGFWSWRGRRMAALIRDEIAGRYYDAGEIARRIRGLEVKGLYVSSIGYALISLESRPSSRPLRQVRPPSARERDNLRKS